MSPSGGNPRSMVCTSPGIPMTVRDVSPSPALTAAHSPGKLGLVIVARHGRPASCSESRPGLRTTRRIEHCQGKGLIRSVFKFGACDPVQRQLAEDLRGLGWRAAKSQC